MTHRASTLISLCLLISVEANAALCGIGGPLGKPLTEPSSLASIPEIHPVSTSKKSGKGKIIKVEGNRAWINMGEMSGVQVGDQYTVISVGEALVDPDTGQVLGQDESVVSEGQIVEVQARFSIMTLSLPAGSLLLPDDAFGGGGSGEGSSTWLENLFSCATFAGPPSSRRCARQARMRRREAPPGACHGPTARRR